MQISWLRRFLGGSVGRPLVVELYFQPGRPWWLVCTIGPAAWLVEECPRD